ncbi:glycoprotein [Grosmannia clavigera kw1407]|uniref:Glycoprotein n=1 Tax=Grosmannia clavigera (strain kw1407 / UAMH 11150) TaxID=655863 RepID=F0XNP0_GROCL|nr:glycoprotein [Grosmannia clavigera kw1407]EFX00737.1 glycoprotein [Grosmannia clavigera kw1407]
MQFFATALFAAAVVSADAVFQVTNFAAACVPHSVECKYSFNVMQMNAGETVANICSASAVSSNTLPAITDGKCNNSYRTFTVTRDHTAGLTLAVTQMVSPASNQVATHLIPLSQITTTNDKVANVESYNGPTSFTLSD